MEKKLDGNYTRMLQAILNKSWRQYSTKQQLYGHFPPIMKTIQVRRTRHAGHCWKNRDKLISDVLLWTPSHGWAKQVDLLESTYNRSVLIRDVILRTSEKRWPIEKGGRRTLGIFVLMVRHEDDDDILVPEVIISDVLCLSLDLSTSYSPHQADSIRDNQSLVYTKDNQSLVYTKEKKRKKYPRHPFF